jgi:hypothetical protein
LGHVINSQHLKEELGSRRGHIDDLLWSGVPQHVQEDLMMDPGQVKDADSCVTAPRPSSYPRVSAASSRLGRYLRKAVR